eukprot:5097069-Prymnesium_polylepis.1
MVVEVVLAVEIGQGDLIAAEAQAPRGRGRGIAWRARDGRLGGLELHEPQHEIVGSVHHDKAAVGTMYQHVRWTEPGDCGCRRHARAKRLRMARQASASTS